MPNNYYFTNELVLRVADFVYFDPFKMNSDKHELQYSTKKLIANENDAFPYCIIYADLGFFVTFELFTKIQVPFILVTSENDSIVPYIDYHNKNDIGERILNNKNLLRWFTVNKDSNDSRIVSIPIGLPRSIQWIKDYYMQGYYNHVTMPVYASIFSQKIVPYENIFNVNKKLLFMKWSNETSENSLHKYKFIRKESKEILEKNGFVVDLSLIPFGQFHSELPKYKFCLSLPGRGLDCYRTWEALYLGVIPIVIKTDEELYKDLPVVMVDSVSEITPVFLNEKFEEIVKNRSSYNWEKIGLDYWVELILNYRTDVKSN